MPILATPTFGLWTGKICYAMASPGSLLEPLQTYWIWNCFFFFLIYFFIIYIYFWLCWVFVSVRGLSPAVASGGHSSSRRAGLAPSRPLSLRSTGSRRAGSAVVAHGPSCSAARGIFPDQGPNPCPLHWQADSQPLRHQGSPKLLFNNAACWNHLKRLKKYRYLGLFLKTFIQLAWVWPRHQNFKKRKTNSSVGCNIQQKSLRQSYTIRYLC